MVEEPQASDQDLSEESQLPQSPLLQKGYLVAGKYELEYKVGLGGMGSVWAARHTSLGQRAAVKFISPAHIESEDALRRFDREAKAAASIRSRNVVQVFDNGQLEDGTPYMVMEFLEGESLHARIQRVGSLPVSEALRIVRHVGKALAVAHKMDIIHRDIKPENVFLATSPEDDECTAKVIDFGVAKFLQARGPAHARTRTGTILGTPIYMSPEQVRGLKTIDHRTDIYSLGALTFTMMTGTVVFSGKTFGDLLFQICTEPLPKMTAAADWLPPAVDRWFEKSCARNPDERYQTVLEQVDGLAEAVDVPIRHTNPEFWESSRNLGPLIKAQSAMKVVQSDQLQQGVSPATSVTPLVPAGWPEPEAASIIQPTENPAFADPDPMERSANTALAHVRQSQVLTIIVVVGFILLIVIAVGAFYLGGKVGAKRVRPPATSQPAR